MAIQRIRDPIHDLIEFSTKDSELERELWKVLQTRPFQRLRRIKQLGFSDLVYPGASHSRFAHSVGVFHTARQLMEIVRRHLSQRSDAKQNEALAAALVHDLGHGPFSHSFEKVGKRLGLKLADHEHVSDLLIRDSEVAECLTTEMGSGFANDVANVIKESGQKTVHHAVVSSQFDADRLDYMRRDRLMTGSQHAAIDFRWLLANLEIGSVPRGVDERQLPNIETFVLGPKSIHAAEAYVLGLFQLYPTIYFHKATRGAEILCTELLVQLVTLVRGNNVGSTGLPGSHPLIRFAEVPEDIENVLSLDDTVVWGALSQMAEATDPVLVDFAKRLRDRKLYKCHDIRSAVAHELDPEFKNDDGHIEKIDKCCAAIKEKLTDWAELGEGNKRRVLIDEAERSPYKSIEESEGPLDRINVRTDGGNLIDLRERSSVVRALRTYKIFRAYYERHDEKAKKLTKEITKGEIKACLG